MQELFESWWYGYLIVPLAITILVGSLLAVWTGQFVARLSAFNEMKLTAVRSIGSLYRLVIAQDEKAVTLIKLEVSYDLTMVQISAITIRQPKLSDYLNHIKTKLDELTVAGLLARITQDGVTDQDVLRSRLLSIIRVDSATYADMIFGLKPDWYPLITLRPQPGPDEVVISHHPLPIAQVEAASRRRIEKRDKDKGV